LNLAQETLASPAVNVQPNIVTKQGPIADELRKMRTLLAKVTDHLNRSKLRLEPIKDNTSEPEEMDVEKWDSLTQILDQANSEVVT